MKIYQEIKNVFTSKVSGKILAGILIAIIALVIFFAGTVVGFHRARFGNDWEEHYRQNFGMMPMMRNGFGFGEDYFPNAHGAIGKIIKIELPNIIVEDKDNTEKVILTDPNTQIQNARNLVTASDLKIDDYVVVIGTPNDKGVIVAKLIRIIPEPEILN